MFALLHLNAPTDLMSHDGVAPPVAGGLVEHLGAHLARHGRLGAARRANIRLQIEGEGAANKGQESKEFIHDC